MHENSADGINNADNQLVAYLNDGLVYNKSHENNPPLNDVMDLSDKLIPGTNSLSILGVNWSGPATYKGSVSLDGMITPWGYEANSPPVGVIWRKVFVITNPSGATVTIKFSGLVPGNRTNSYSESGYNLSGDSIFAAFDDGTIGAFPSNSDTLFTFKKADSASFDMISVMLRSINDTVGSQTIDFTGNLTAGGTVTHRIETSADQNQYSTFTFPASFHQAHLPRVESTGRRHDEFECGGVRRAKVESDALGVLEPSCSPIDA